MAKQEQNTPGAEDKEPWELVLLLPEEAAKILKTSVDTLADWRCRRLGGPQWITVGRLIRYRECDLRDWLNSRVQKNTNVYQPSRRRR